MRNIKFRAYNKELNKMTLPFTLGDLYDPSVYQYDFTDGEYCCTDDMDFDELIFMQYTGLKDKNGEEIYEGDIIIFPHNKNPQIIEWNEYWGCYKNFNSVNTGYEVVPDRCEIIGNIYENPELSED